MANLNQKILPPVFKNKDLEDVEQLLLHNNDVKISIGLLTKPHTYFQRNADGDELYFIHEGSGVFETIYGHITFQKGDYLIIPRGTTFWQNIKEKTKYLLVESSSEYSQPNRGLLGPNALYDQSAIFVPKASKGTLQQENYRLRIKRLNELYLC